MASGETPGSNRGVPIPLHMDDNMSPLPPRKRFFHPVHHGQGSDDVDSSQSLLSKLCLLKSCKRYLHTLPTSCSH